MVSNVSSISVTDTPEAWNTAFSTDIQGTVNVIQAALPHLEKRKGSIVTISSVSGRDVDFTAPSPYAQSPSQPPHPLINTLRSIQRSLHLIFLFLLPFILKGGINIEFQIRRIQSSAHPLHLPTSTHSRPKRHPRQHRLSRQHLHLRRRLGWHREK